MSTITDIRNDLVDVFNKLRDGTMEAKDAVEINNTAGKIISSVKVQLAYAALKGETPDIPFLRAPNVIEEQSKMTIATQEPIPEPMEKCNPNSRRRMTPKELRQLARSREQV